MRLTEATLPIFARHETFHPRYGWFRKAYDAAARDPQAFEREDAPVKIGVGKNMVRAIRFWGLAADLITESSIPGRRGKRVVPTPFGERLFGERGWDPWMEDPGTLWLLHWRLLRAPCRLPVWWLAFNEFHPIEFTDDDLEGAISAHLDAAAGWSRPSRSSLKKDVSALLRTYAPAAPRGRVSLDDTLDGPLRELRLLDRAPAGARYRFQMGPKPLLPAEVLAAAALDYAVVARKHGSTMPLATLASEAGSPGRAFRLAEAELAEALASVAARTPGLDLVASAGIWVLSWSGSALTLHNEILNRYFQDRA